MENTSPGGAFFKKKTLRAPQPQHKELSRELWALMKRASLNYPTAPGINPSNLQPWSHCSSSSHLQNLGSFRGRLLGFFFPLQTNTKRKESRITSRLLCYSTGSCTPGNQSRMMPEFLPFSIKTSRKQTSNSGIIWKQATENHPPSCFSNSVAWFHSFKFRLS